MQETFTEMEQEEQVDGSKGTYLCFKRIWDKEGGDAEGYEAFGKPTAFSVLLKSYTRGNQRS